MKKRSVSISMILQKIRRKLKYMTNSFAQGRDKVVGIDSR